MDSAPLVWILISWLQNCRRCPCSRVLVWLEQGLGLEVWVYSPHWSARPSSTRVLDQLPPVVYQVPASLHPLPLTRNNDPRFVHFRHALLGLQFSSIARSSYGRLRRLFVMFAPGFGIQTQLDHCFFVLSTVKLFHFLFSQSTQTLVFEIGGHKQFYMVFSHANHPQPLTHAVLCSQPTKCWCHSGTPYPGREPGLVPESAPLRTNI